MPRGGHVPAEGLKTGGGPTQPFALPGVALAAIATLGLGLVFGPEAPLIAIGTGLAILAVRLVRKDVPQQLLGLMAAAGSFAAISTIFGSPVIGAAILIEAAGLGGPTLPLVLLPGRIAPGLGSLVFIGVGDWTGLSTSAWALQPFALPPFGGPGWGDIGWAIVLAIAAAVGAFVVVRVARLTTRLVSTRPFVLTTSPRSRSGGSRSPSISRPTNQSTQSCSRARMRLRRWSKTLPRSRCPRCRSCSSSRGSPGASHWAIFGVARPSRPSFGARSEVS
jgi:hypothetical protein